MTFFSTYLDASKEGPERVYTLAGFIADEEGWQGFGKNWREVLGHFDLKHFHMKDFEGTKEVGGFGEFEGWSRDDKRRIPLLTALLGVIEKWTIGSVAFSISEDLYHHYITPEVSKIVQGSPYFFLFLNLLVGNERLMNRSAQFNAGIPPDWQMAYFLAKGDQGAGSVAQSFTSTDRRVREALDLTRTQMVGYIESDNSEYPALEAADLLAYEVRKQVGKQVGSNKYQVPRKLYERLEESIWPKSWKFYLDPLGFQINLDTIERGTLGKDATQLWVPPT